MPSSSDKTAATAESTLISVAAAIVNNTYVVFLSSHLFISQGYEWMFGYPLQIKIDRKHFGDTVKALNL